MTEKKESWKAGRDPLFRGDSARNPRIPVPVANEAIVRHILYLDGYGRETPYLSMTEDRDVAARYAGNNGRIYSTTVNVLKSNQVKHISRRELMQILKGTGRGLAAWKNAFEVMMARRYVEENAEHLADFRHLRHLNNNQLRNLAKKIFN